MIYQLIDRYFVPLHIASTRIGLAKGDHKGRFEATINYKEWGISPRRKDPISGKTREPIIHMVGVFETFELAQQAIDRIKQIDEHILNTTTVINKTNDHEEMRIL